MYGEQIKNIANATDLSDAVNLNQLRSAISSIEIPTKVSEFENDSKYANISVDGEVTTEFKVQHVSQDEYHELVNLDGGIDSNTLYIVSSSNLNAYGEQIKNIAPGTDLSDAVNLEQLKAIESALKENVNNKVFIDGISSESISVDSLNIVKLSRDEYKALQDQNAVCADVVYVTNFDELDMYGKSIKNVASATKSTDAINLGQLNSAINDISATATSKIDNKVFVDGISAEQLSVNSMTFVQLTRDEYHELRDTGNICSDYIYITDFDQLDMHQNKIVDLAEGTDDNDAVTVKQLKSTATSIKVDDVQVSSLNVKNISQSEYHDLVIGGNISQNELYIVSSDAINAYGERIINVSNAEISSDAINLNQLKTYITDFQVIRPNFVQKPLKLKVKLFANQEMTELVGEIDSSAQYMAAFFNNPDSLAWHNFSEDGLASIFSNCPVLVKLSNWLADNGLTYKYEKLFISYSWYYIENGEEHISDTYSIVVPSYTEVGANASDYISKTEHELLASEIRKDAYILELNEDDMYVCYSNKTNIFDTVLAGDIQIILDAFALNKQYDIKFTAGDNLQLKFFHDLGINGPEFDSSWNINNGYEFFSGITYLIKIKQDLIEIVESTSPSKNLSYKLVTAQPESDGTTYNIKNRTITTIKISDGSTPIQINMPSSIDGNYARDFILRVEITSSEAPRFTFTGVDSSWIVESDDDNWYMLEPGINVISFTEMA